jgi:hypothetical protein
MAAVTEAASHTPLAETDEAQVPSRSCRFSSERLLKVICPFFNVSVKLGVTHSS